MNRNSGVAIIGRRQPQQWQYRETREAKVRRLLNMRDTLRLIYRDYRALKAELRA